MALSGRLYGPSQGTRNASHRTFATLRPEFPSDRAKRRRSLRPMPVRTAPGEW